METSISPYTNPCSMTELNKHMQLHLLVIRFLQRLAAWAAAGTASYAA